MSTTSGTLSVAMFFINPGNVAHSAGKRRKPVRVHRGATPEIAEHAKNDYVIPWHAISRLYWRLLSKW
jgi:hypothetical protein